MPYNTYERSTIPPGEQGTKVTVRRIIHEIIKGTEEPSIRAHAVEAVKRCSSKKKLCEIRKTFEYLKNNYTFRNDPVSAELLHTAKRLADLMVGDCDDAVILAGSMLRSIGIPIRLVVIGHLPETPSAFTHIYLQAQNPYTKDWYGFDVSVPESTLGWEPPNWIRKVYIQEGPSGKWEWHELPKRRSR